MHLVRLMWSSAFESPPDCPQSFSRLSRSDFEYWLRRRRRYLHEIKLYWIGFFLCEIRLLNQAKSNMFYGNRSDFCKIYFFLENGRSVERLHARRMKLANILSEWLRNPGSWNPKNIPGEACPRTPLETYPIGARLENRSVFILVPPRDAVARRHLMCKMKQNWMQGWQYGKGLIYLRSIFRLTKLAFLRTRAVQRENVFRFYSRLNDHRWNLGISSRGKFHL